MYTNSNRLTGTLLAAWGDHTSMRDLQLSDNRFTGILTDRSVAVTMQVLRANRNSFSGNLPVAVSKLSHLHDLQVHSNKFTGSIPQIIHVVVALQILDISKNKISGMVPFTAGGGARQAIQSLNANGNSLFGSIPDSIGNMRRLNHLALSYNKLEGVLPIAFNRMRALVRLQLSGNRPSLAHKKTLVVPARRSQDQAGNKVSEIS